MIIINIYVTKQGDTLNSIAEEFDVPVSRIVADNEIADPDRLTVGQTIVILYPRETYTVEAGDTLYSIAKKYRVTINQLYRNNPSLGGYPDIYPGDELVIDYRQKKMGSLATNGYVYPSVDIDVLRKTLPYLTYLTVFSHKVLANGEIVGIGDSDIVNIAREYDTAPLMAVTTLNAEDEFDTELASTILNSEELQDKLINNILDILRARKYYGVDIDFEYIKQSDKQEYSDFIRKLTRTLNKEGFIVLCALAPKTSNNQKGLLYEGIDYRALGRAANFVILMTYEWGYTYGPPMAVSPINEVKRVVDYAVGEIRPNKIFLGIPNYGYDWTLPYVSGKSVADSITNVEAVDIALDNWSEILFDEKAQTPYFFYTDNGTRHEVWFEDARSIRSKLALIQEYGLYGGAYWNVMNYFPQNYLVLNSLYNIDRVL